MEFKGTKMQEKKEKLPPWRGQIKDKMFRDLMKKAKMAVASLVGLGRKRDKASK